MALVSLPSPIAWPGLCGNSNGAGPFTSTAATLTSAGHYVAYVTVAREDMTISHVGMRFGASVGSPTITVTIETLDSAGLPNGAGFGSSSGTTGTVSSNTNVLQALGASATITKGTAFAVKIALASGTSQVVQNLQNGSFRQSNLPYSVLNTGTPTKTLIQNNIPAVAFGSSSTTFYQVPDFWPASTAGVSTFNNTSSARRGLRFTPPMSCRAVGLRWYNGNSTGDYNAILFNDAGTELSNSSTAFVGTITSAQNSSTMTVYFDNPVILTGGATYRIAIEPSSATNVSIATITLPSTDYRSATPAGTIAQYTTYVTGTGWDDSLLTQAPLMDVMLDQLDNGVSTGGGGGIIGA